MFVFSNTLQNRRSKNLFRKIFLPNKPKIRFFSFINIVKNFSFILKPLRDIYFILKTKKRVFNKKQNRLFITYGDYRNITEKNNWKEEIFRGLVPSDKDEILVLSLGKSINDIVKNIRYINSCNSKQFIYSNYSFVSKVDIFIAFLKSNFIL